MQFGVNCAASFEAARQARLAEDLGFSHIGFYDSPALEPDVWITIATAVQATKRIMVGPEVLIPHLRHPMVTASCIATIENLAPGRLYVGIGTGFTGRMAMGQRPVKWSYLRQYVLEVKALLAGSRVDVDGAVMQMMHPPGFAPSRPIGAPFLVAANGPRGIEVAREVADGLIFNGPWSGVPAGFSELQLAPAGIVLEPGEAPSSSRVRDAAQIMFGLQYHLAYEGSTPDAPIDVLPDGDVWRRSIEAIDPKVRHLSVHDRHAVGVNAHDAAFIAEHQESLAAVASRLAATPEEMRARVQTAVAKGATRASFALWLGNDWESAMRAYADAVFA